MAIVQRLALATSAAAVILASIGPAQAFVVGGYRILPLPHFYERTGGLPPGGGDGPLYYFGGSVFSKVKIVTVMWGSDVSAETVTKIPPFSSAIVNSTYMDQMAEYGTRHHKGRNGHGSTHQTISRGVYVGQVQIAPKHNGAEISDADVQKELSYQIANAILPPNDLDTLYMIYFPADVTIELDGLVSCRDFGAYHFAKRTGGLRGSNLFYTVEPECNSGFSYLTFAASHEFAEAVTDNIPTPGNVPDFPQAWNDLNGGEAADLCPFEGSLSDGTDSWTVSQFYLNSVLGCSMGDYRSP